MVTSGYNSGNLSKDWLADVTRRFGYNATQNPGESFHSNILYNVSNEVLNSLYMGFNTFQNPPKAVEILNGY